MVEVNKIDEKRFESTSDESLDFPSTLKSSKKKNGSNNGGFKMELDDISESSFNTFSEALLSQRDAFISLHPAPIIREGNIQYIPQKCSFQIVIFEQCLKVFATIYVTVGFIASVLFLSEQFAVEQLITNKTLLITGIVKGLLSLSVSVLAIWYRILLHGHSNYRDSMKSENPTYFFTVISISSAISWLYFLLLEFRNINCLKSCPSVPSLIIPLTQMIFIITVVIVMFDLIFFKIKDDTSKGFYVIYKSTSVLLFANSINCLIFNLFDALSGHLQIFLSKNSSGIYCYSQIKNDSYVTLIKNVGPIFQVSTLVFYISSILILIKPLQQFSMFKMNRQVRDNPLIFLEIDENVQGRNNPQYSAFALPVAIFFFIFSISSIPLDFHEKKHVYEVAFNSLPIFIHILTGFLCIYILKVLYNNCNIYNKNTSKGDVIVLWLSLFGQISSCLIIIINNSQFLLLPNNKMIDIEVYITAIALFSGTALQSLLQAMTLDFINCLNKNVLIHKECFQKLTFSIVILISCNCGFFITNLYLLSGFTSFKKFNDDFNLISWNLINSISEPFTLIFRGYSFLFLLRFLLNLNCRDD